MASTNNSNNTENIYLLRCKKGSGAVVNLHFSALNDEVATQRATKFCAKHGFRYIFTKPFLTDLENYPSL